MKLLGRTRSRSPRRERGTTTTPVVAAVMGYSLGTGEVSSDGSNVERFEAGNNKDDRTFSSTRASEDHSPLRRRASLMKIISKSRIVKKIITEKPFKRDLCAFLRVTELKLEHTCVGSYSDTPTCADSFSEADSPTAASSTSNNNSSNEPNFHHASHLAPPGIAQDPLERWVALDDGDGQHAPIAPLAVAALVQSAADSTLADPSMWTPDGKTAKLLKNPTSWHDCTWELAAANNNSSNNKANNKPWHYIPPADSPAANQVLVWSGNYAHGGYGSDLPAVRATGIIPMAPYQLLQLLIDSDRVHEYNQLSLGRTDVLVLQDDMDPHGTFGGITKIMRSETRPPLLRKTLQFTSLLHARQRPGGQGYKIVTRAVEGLHATTTHCQSGILKSEILLGVNVILPIPDDPQRCIMIAVNHIRSPMVPMMIAKRIGLQAAVNFFADLRQAAVRANHQ